ncbi:MAG: S8 family serine peptidase [Bacteroidales bacterium]|nr:S8 family serine peptidase [Bacteroidales bacterium]
MKKILLVFSMFFLLLTFSTNLFGQKVNSLWVDGRIYFKVSDHVNLNFPNEDGSINPKDVYFLENLITKYGITEMIMSFKSAESDILQRTFRLDFSEHAQIKDLLDDLNSMPDIEYAEPAPLFFISYVPDDPYYNVDLSATMLGSANSSWHLNLINAEQAWDITTGDTNIVVAVLDNAIWIDHPDLQGKVTIAVDLGNGDDDPNPPEATYIWSHGTHSAGLIAAGFDNGIGVSSIGGNVSIMAVKLGDDASDGQAMAAGFEAIVWAADNGADVINMSWGSPTFFQTMQNIVNYAYNKGCVLVGAAGNNGNGMESQMNPDIPINYVGYPAALNHVIAVGSCDIGDNKSDFSNYGEWIDVLSPGGYATQGLMGIGAFTILSTTYNDAASAWGALTGSTGGAGSYGVEGKYDLMQGTSMAAPITSGLCGLMLSANPNLTPEELIAILKNTCDNVDAQNADYIGQIGAGRINAYAAVSAAAALADAPLVADFEASAIVIPEGGTVDFNDLSIGTPISWSWEFEGGTPATSTEQNPSGITYPTAGVYAVTLTVTDDDDNTDTEIKTTLILVGQSGALAESAWLEQHTRFPSPYRGVFQTDIANDNTAWVLTYDGTGGGITRDFAKTGDGGTTWIPNTLDVPENLSPGDISAIDDMNAWVALYDTNGGGGIYKTTDGGETWTHQTSAAFDNSASFCNGVHMFNENDGYCIGDPVNGEFELYLTNDGGENWTLIDGNNIPDPQSNEMGWTGVNCALGDNTWFGTSTGRVYRSTDKGQTWTAYATGQSNVSSISFADENNGVAICATYNQTTGAIQSWKLIRTNDGGENWEVITVEDQYLTDISAVPGKPGMYVGVKISQTIEANYSVYSLDYGTTWEMLDDSVQYTNVKMFNQNTGWAGGFNMDENSSGIYKWLGIPNQNNPYFTSLPVTNINEGEEYTYNIVAEDPNELELTITAQEKPDWLELTDNGDGTATLTGTAPTITQESQEFNVTLRASNGEDIGEQVFTITVHTTNTPPEFVSEPVTSGMQYVLYEYNVEATDADGDAITLSATTLPDWAEFVDNGDGTGKVTGTPTEKSTIGYQIKIQASDGIHEVEQSFRVKVSESYVEDFGYGKINIFPNPTKNILNIQNCQNTNYEIFDVNGKVLQTGKIYDSIQTLDMSNFAKGNIFIKLQDNENIYIMKIVKM